MNEKPIPQEDPQAETDRQAPLPYEPPRVQSVKLTPEAAESLT
jgi:hypothetical protein